MIEECRDLLLTVTLQDDSSDMWLWLPDQSGGYTVRGVYDMVDSVGTTPYSTKFGVNLAQIGTVESLYLCLATVERSFTY